MKNIMCCNRVRRFVGQPRQRNEAEEGPEGIRHAQLRPFFEKSILLALKKQFVFPIKATLTATRVAARTAAAGKSVKKEEEEERKTTGRDQGQPRYLLPTPKLFVAWWALPRSTEPPSKECKNVKEYSERKSSCFPS